ncbi:MAG TPA: DUF695 domain-containing protein [Labilithrix sp.]|nr:DUF695 domain-containing protein [Labilithrix sp.]
MSFFKKLFGKKRAEPGAQTGLDDELKHWRILDMRNGDERVIARVRINRPDLPDLAAFRTAVSVVWPFEGDEGWPDPETKAAMDSFEDALIELSSENDFSYLMLVRTGLGARVWLYYTADLARFTSELESRTSALGEPPIRVEATVDPEWGEWSMVVRRAQRTTDA